MEVERAPYKATILYIGLSIRFHNNLAEGRFPKYSRQGFAITAYDQGVELLAGVGKPLSAELAWKAHSYQYELLSMDYGLPGV